MNFKTTRMLSSNEKLFESGDVVLGQVVLFLIPVEQHLDIILVLPRKEARDEGKSLRLCDGLEKTKSKLRFVFCSCQEGDDLCNEICIHLCLEQAGEWVGRQTKQQLLLLLVPPLERLPPAEEVSPVAGRRVRGRGGTMRGSFSSCPVLVRLTPSAPPAPPVPGLCHGVEALLRQAGDGGRAAGSEDDTVLLSVRLGPLRLQGRALDVLFELLELDALGNRLELCSFCVSLMLLLLLGPCELSRELLVGDGCCSLDLPALALLPPPL
mmetsp:Transcript_18679/g.42743  ORF Transcript_18679/g.42743 Transcript_18679/m.42743 type:complete len:267 (+) Transcript_18679:1470-2270(+)